MYHTEFIYIYSDAYVGQHAYICDEINVIEITKSLQSFQKKTGKPDF